MKILSSIQIRDLDHYTIDNEPISSIDLMERASTAFVEWFKTLIPAPSQFPLKIICGMGDNGGDGLVIARQLKKSGYDPEVIVIAYTRDGSPNFTSNLARLKNETTIEPLQVRDDVALKQINLKGVVIDALFGSGLNRPVEGLAKNVIDKINGDR